MVIHSANGARQLIKILALLLGMLAIINGVIMIFSPEPWYWAVAGVADRGPFNQHFLRDIGIIYLLIGIAFIIGTFYLKLRFALWLMPTAWLTGHAVFHFWEVATGICEPESIIEDFAGVTLPAMIASWLTYRAFKDNDAFY